MVECWGMVECSTLPNTSASATTPVRKERCSGNTIIIVRGRAELLVSKGVHLPSPTVIQRIC